MVQVHREGDGPSHPSKEKDHVCEQSDMYATTLRITGAPEERQQVEPTYGQVRAALLGLVTAALRDTDSAARAEVEIVDLVDERVVIYLSGSVAEIHDALTGEVLPRAADSPEESGPPGDSVDDNHSTGCTADFARLGPRSSQRDIAATP